MSDKLCVTIKLSRYAAKIVTSLFAYTRLLTIVPILKSGCKLSFVFGLKIPVGGRALSCPGGTDEMVNPDKREKSQTS